MIAIWALGQTLGLLGQIFASFALRIHFRARLLVLCAIISGVRFRILREIGNKIGGSLSLCLSQSLRLLGFSNFNLFRKGGLGMRRSRAEERRFFRDLELRLGPSWPPKECMFAGNCERRYPDVITINDDEEEDDVLMYSMCPASSVPALELFPIRAAWVPVVTEEDLELRLGSRATQSNDVGRKEPLPSWRSFKRTKSGLASTSRQHLVIEEGVQLRCTICMDTMKEETSTICGHVFCKSCITSAIRTQNKCPTCRKELNMGSIHRIYLPGATS